MTGLEELIFDLLENGRIIFNLCRKKFVLVALLIKNKGQVSKFLTCPFYLVTS